MAEEADVVAAGVEGPEKVLSCTICHKTVRNSDRANAGAGNGLESIFHKKCMSAKRALERVPNLGRSEQDS